MSAPLRIFVVEDEALILMHIEVMLQDAGHVVVGTAMTASDAIAMIPSCQPELVLIDVRLGDGSSGVEVVHAIRDLGGITAAFLTANASQFSDEMEGATAVIGKPVTEKTLGAALAYLEKCVHQPPPPESVPRGMRVAPGYLASFAALPS